MGYIGSLGEELLRAFGRGAETTKVRLHGITDDALKRHGLGTKATDAIRQAVADDPALMVELLDELQFTDALIRRFAERRLSSLKALGVNIPAGQLNPDTHDCRARRDAESGGHRRYDTHSAAAPAQNDRASHARCDTHTTGARPAANPPRGLSAMKGAAAVVRRCVLDTLTVNGQPLRAVTPDEALKWAETMATRAMMVGHICSGLAPLVPIGEQLTDAEAEARVKV